VLVGVTVSSIWEYHRNSALERQDKDFMKLNKKALANRATTAHVSKRLERLKDGSMLQVN